MGNTDNDAVVAFERQVIQDKAANFRGTALIHMRHLDFANPIRPLSGSIVQRLKRNFGLAGCLQYEPEYRIPAIIDSDNLDSSLRASGTTREMFKATRSLGPIQLQFQDNVRLNCLHGQHRIVAAKEHLPPKDHWWVVDLYGNGERIHHQKLLTLILSRLSRQNKGEIT